MRTSQLLNLVTTALLAHVSPAYAACGDGTPDASVTGSGSSYTATKGSEEVYSGSDYYAAIQGALDAVSSGQRVAVLAAGSIGTNTITIDSGKTLEGCETITAAYRAGYPAIESVDTTGASIPYLSLAGDVYFGLRFYGARDLALGEVTLDLERGIGIRFDRDEAPSANVTMGTITQTGGSEHAIETWNIDGLEIGSVIARNVGQCGLLLQNSRNVRVGLVDAQNTGTGTGYAALRFANRNGRSDDGSYPTSVYVDKVVATGGGRGVFCVSESGGAEIGEIELSETGGDVESILIQNCYNVNILGGTVSGGGPVRIAASSEFANTRDITIALDVSDTTVRESPCGENITWELTGNAEQDLC